MGAGAIGLMIIGLLTGRVAILATFGPHQWLAGVYLGIGGGALAFILWGTCASKNDANARCNHDDC